MVAEMDAMQPTDVEQIARLVLRDYALPLMFDAITHDGAGQCTVGFLEQHGGGKTRAPAWGGGKNSPHPVRAAPQARLGWCHETSKDFKPEASFYFTPGPSH